MRYHHITYLLLPLLCLLFGCKQEGIRPEDDTASSDPRTLTFRATVNDAVTRAMVEEIDGSLDLSVKFTPKDKILLFVSQADTTFSSPPSRPMSVRMARSVSSRLHFPRRSISLSR